MTSFAFPITKEDEIAAQKRAEARRAREQSNHITNPQGETQTMHMHAEAITKLASNIEAHEWEIGRHLYEARQLAEDAEACKREGIEGPNPDTLRGLAKWLKVFVVSTDTRNLSESVPPASAPRAPALRSPQGAGRPPRQVGHLRAGGAEDG